MPTREKVAVAVLELRGENGQLLSTLNLSSAKLRDVEGAFGKVDKSIGTLQQRLASAGTALSIGLTAPLAAAGAAAIKLGMDAIESENLVTVSFGNMKGAADEWSKRLSEQLGLNQFEMRKTAGTLFNMTTSMGIARDEAFKMATGVAQLAADMSSFRNIPMEEALLKIRSGLTGEAEPLKAIGILVDEATVKQEAYRIGLVNVGAELTQQEKVQARWSAILRQTANDQGDLARTLDSPANQLRIMKSRVTEAATALGVQLMPYVQQLLEWLSKLIPKIQDAVKWFEGLPKPAKDLSLALALFLASAGPGLLFTSWLLNIAKYIKVLAGAEGFISLAGGLGKVRDAVIGLNTAVTASSWLSGALIAGGLGLGVAGFIALAAHLKEKSSEVADQMVKDREKMLAGANGLTESYAKTKITIQQAAAAAQGAAGPITFLGKAIGQAGAEAGAGGGLAKRLADARVELEKLRAAGRMDDLARDLKGGIFDQKELQTEYGLSEDAIKLFKEQLAGAADVAKEASKAQDEHIEAMHDTARAAAGAQAAIGDMVQDTLRQMAYYIDAVRGGNLDPRRAVVTGISEDTMFRLKSSAIAMRDLVALPSTPSVGWMQNMAAGASSLATAIDGAKAAHDKLIDGFKSGLAGAAQILDNLGGRWTEFAATVIRTASAMAERLAQGDWIGAAVAGITGAITAISRAFRSEESEKVNRPRQQYIDAAGGLAVLNQKLMEAAGNIELVHQLLNADTEAEYKAAIDAINKALERHNEIVQGASRFGPSSVELADAAKKAREVYDYMVASQVYTAEQIKAAYDAMRDAQAAAGDIAARAEVEARKAGSQRMEQMGADLRTMLAERDKLAQGLAGEAAEETAGIIETQQRAELEKLDEQLKNKSDEYARLARETGQAMADEIVKALRAIHIEPIDVPVNVQVPQPPTGGVTGGLPNGGLPDGYEMPLQGADEPYSMARGAFGRTTGPTWFYSGGNEDFAFMGEHGGSLGDTVTRKVMDAMARSGGSSQPLEITVNTLVDGRTLARSVHRAYNDHGELRNEGRQVLGVRM